MGVVAYDMIYTPCEAGGELKGFWIGGEMRKYTFLLV